MKEQIQWTPKLNKASDWDGIELNDPATGLTHASLDSCTPDALALIVAAPQMLEALLQLHSMHRAFSSNENWTGMDDEARELAEDAIAAAAAKPKV
mgnify:CR=1 FL=1